MTTQNTDRVWRLRAEIEEFRNIERAANHQIARENGVTMPLLFRQR